MCKMEEEDLEQQIELLRDQLELIVKDKGYTHVETIKVSQQLDLLLNKLQKTIEP